MLDESKVLKKISTRNLINKLKLWQFETSKVTIVPMPFDKVCGSE